MTHHVLLSVTFRDENQGELVTCLAEKLKQMGFHASSTTHPDFTLITAAQPFSLPTPELPVPAEQPVEVPAEAPQAVDPVPAETAPADAPAVEVEVETAAGDVEIEMPVKFESTCRVLDLSLTEQFLAAAGNDEVSKLIVSNVATANGSISFTHGNTQYKFPTNEAGLIQVSVDTTHKIKRIQLQVVEADADKNLPAGAVLLGASDAVLLIAEA